MFTGTPPCETTEWLRVARESHTPAGSGSLHLRRLAVVPAGDPHFGDAARGSGGGHR